MFYHKSLEEFLSENFEDFLVKNFGRFLSEFFKVFVRIFIRFLSEVFAEFQVKTLEEFLSEKLWRIFNEMSTPQYQSYGGTAKTPQYQSYGGTTARTDSSPASRLDVFKKPLDPDLLAKVRNCFCMPITFNNAISKLFLIIDILF